MAKKTRRSHGEGSVYRRSDGRWVAAIDLGWIDGKRRRKTVYGATEREVLASVMRYETSRRGVST